jgi:DnaJ like chaperone protein
MRWSAALAVILALLLYLRSPIDLLPDRIGAVGLLDDLVLVAAVTWWMRRRAARARAARAEPPAAVGRNDPSSDAPWDPYAILGVARGASAEEIATAYREQMRRYHPDRVAHLGEELQRLAHRKTLDIQRAYTELGKP